MTHTSMSLTNRKEVFAPMAASTRIDRGALTFQVDIGVECPIKLHLLNMQIHSEATVVSRGGVAASSV